VTTLLATLVLKKLLLRPGVWSGVHATKLLMRRLRSWLVVVALALAAACTSPTLPLPPPALPTITTGTTPEHFKLSSPAGGAEPNALIIVVNRNPDLPRTKRVSGTIADDQGAWEVEVFASTGDFLDVSQEAAGVRSPTQTVQVR